MGTPIRVLHADDDPEFADIATQFIEREVDGLTVTTAESASEGLALLSERDFHCVVSDYDMPDMNGLEFLETIREEYPDLPFILFTGKGSEEIASDAISAGVTDYLQKEAGSDQYTVLANRIAKAVEAYRSKRALSERTRRLETLISNLPGIVYRCRNEQEWPVESVEGDLEEFLGYSAEALESGAVTLGEDILHPDDRETVWQTVQEALSEEDSYEITYRMVTAEGDTKWVWERGQGVYAEDGDLEALEGFITDITERRERKRELQRERDRFVTLFENLPNPVVHGTITDEGPVIERVNSAFEETFGFEGEDVRGENLDDLTVPEDQQEEAAELNERLTESGFMRAEVERLTADGRRDFVLSAVLREQGEGPLEGYAIYTDITERKERERKLQTRTQAIEEATDGVAIYEGGEYVYVNQAHAEIYGYDDPDAFLGETWEMCYEQDEIERFQEEIYPEFLDAGSWRGEAVGLRKDGSTFPQELSLTLLDDERLVCVVRDVTERKERERELRDTTRQLQAVLDTVSAAIFMKDADGRYLLMNDNCRELFDVDPDRDVTGMTDADLFPETVAARYREHDQAVFETGESVEVEAEVPTTKGDRIHLTRKSPVFDEDGEPYAVCAVSTDITERIERERKLERQNERLDEFVSIVSHDLRNPLTIAQGRLELARSEHDSDHLNDVAGALERIDQIVEQTLALARSGRTIGEKEPVDLADLAEQCWRSVDTQAADLTVDAVPRITADRERLQHVFENLFRNAIEHGGADVTVSVGACDGGFYVEDDGVGLSGDGDEDLFSPSTSTRQDGSGIGLAIVNRIVEAHGWEIDVSDRPDGGARFEITGVEFVDG